MLAITRSTSSASTDSGRPLPTRDLELEPEPLGVLARRFDRFRREVGGGDLQVGTLRQQRQRDRAGAGADLVHARALGQLRADLDQQLGLPARPEHALVDVDLAGRGKGRGRGCRPSARARPGAGRCARSSPPPRRRPRRRSPPSVRWARRRARRRPGFRPRCGHLRRRRRRCARPRRRGSLPRCEPKAPRSERQLPPLPPILPVSTAPKILRKIAVLRLSSCRLPACRTRQFGAVQAIAPT